MDKTEYFGLTLDLISIEEENKKLKQLLKECWETLDIPQNLELIDRIEEVIKDESEV